jgi:hypothetical protein
MAVAHCQVVVEEARVRPMNPQIVMPEVGVHNADLARTSKRLMEGGSWKKQRVVMVMPAAPSIPAKVALALWGMAFPPNQGAHRMVALGMEVGDAYSSCISEILAHPELSQWEYLLTVEHDNIPPGDGLIRLIAQMEKHPELSCIGGLYFTKGCEGVAQLWGDPNDATINFRPQVPRPGELVECCGTGMGFNLWRLSMFKDERLRRPWFKTQADANGVATQDLYAWSDFRKYGYRCAIDCSVLVGHYDLEGRFGTPDTTW